MNSPLTGTLTENEKYLIIKFIIKEQELLIDRKIITSDVKIRDPENQKKSLAEIKETLLEIKQQTFAKHNINFD